MPAPPTLPSGAPADTPAAAAYWTESQGPLVSLVFMVPLLVVYELGILLLGPLAVRNGADVWLRSWLGLLGFGQYFLLPLIVVGLLLGWHHASGQCWRFSLRTLLWMALESAALAIALLLIARMYAWLFSDMATPGVWAFMGPVPDRAARLVAFVGAGIYEEVLFRLLLLPATLLLLKGGGLPKESSAAAAIMLTSFIFAAAHYVGTYGEPWQWHSFSFRLLAGTVFATLFVYRGFGISAGAHVGYDMLIDCF